MIGLDYFKDTAEYTKGTKSEGGFGHNTSEVTETVVCRRIGERDVLRIKGETTTVLKQYVYRVRFRATPEIDKMDGRVITSCEPVNDSFGRTVHFRVVVE